MAIFGRVSVYDTIPTLDIIDFLFEGLKTISQLQTRTIDGGSKTTRFEDYINIGDLQKRDAQYKAPVLCLFPGYKIENEQDIKSVQRVVKPIPMIDSVIAARLRRDAMRGSIAFADNIAVAIAENFKVYKNIEITVVSQFILNPYSNHEGKEEVVIRSVLAASWGKINS